VVWVSSSSAGGRNSTISGAAVLRRQGRGWMPLAVVYARELTRWGIETSIIVPGAFHRWHESTSPMLVRRTTRHGPRAIRSWSLCGFSRTRCSRGFASIRAGPMQIASAGSRTQSSKVGRCPLWQATFPRATLNPMQDGAESRQCKFRNRVRAELLRRIGPSATC